MPLAEAIDSDLKSALKSSDKIAVSTLRIVKSTIKNREIEKGSPLSDDEVISVLTTLSKQRKESIEHFAKGGRDDLVASETAELEVLKKYLPEQLSDEELDEIVKRAISELGVSDKKEMGKVMKKVMAETKGRADGKLVNQKVASLLN
ncbi:MAG: GatB/YqeY domain-containing protein [Nitrospirota bacterium]|nr:MAG: GatB/YqeY domain-containing protein [Nitrospirota bacterium]